jgi:hypothetical protein
MSEGNIAKRQIVPAEPAMTCHCGAALAMGELVAHVKAEHPGMWDDGPSVIIDATGDTERIIGYYP